MPCGERERNGSMYQAISPRYSARGTTSAFQLPKINPLWTSMRGTRTSPCCGKIEILRKMSIECRRHEPAGPLIGPAVIRANKVTDVARIGTTNFGAAMSAAVQKHMHGAIAVAHYDHRGAAQASGNKISRCRDLSLMGQKTHVRSKIRSISSRNISSLTKTSRLTSPRCTSTQPCVLGRGVPCKPWPTSCEISLTLQISPTASHGKLTGASFSFDRTSDSSVS